MTNAKSPKIDAGNALPACENALQALRNLRVNIVRNGTKKEAKAELAVLRKAVNVLASAITGKAE